MDRMQDSAGSRGASDTTADAVAGNGAAKEGAPARYSRTQIGLHWTIAALVLFQLLVNDAVQVALDDRIEGVPGTAPFLASVHIAVGTTVLVLTVWRLGLRLWQGVPMASKPAPRAIAAVGHLAHLALYGVLFAMPVTGLVAWLQRNDLAAEVHEWLSSLLILLILGHAAGAFVEHTLFRNRTLLRMLGTVDR